MKQVSGRAIVECFGLFILVAVLSSMAMAADGLSGAAEFQYQSVRTHYLQIKKFDSNVKDLDSWENTAGELIKYTENFPDSKFTPNVLFSLGRLYENIYRARKLDRALARAVYFYEQVSTDYTGHSLADDSLLSLGELRDSAMDDVAGAKAAYFEIIDEYGHGDQVAAARQHLAAIEKRQAKEATAKEAKKVSDPQSFPAKPQEESASVEPEKAAVSKAITASQPTAIEPEETTNDGKLIFSTEPQIGRPLIVIDPGHGGDNLGAVGIEGVMEKDVVLHIALFLDELLRERLRARTLLTRTADVSLALEERTKFANDNKADLFVSIHANASEYKTLTGIETYYLDNTNDKSSLKLAERENKVSDAAAIDDVNFIVSDLIQNAKLDDSISLAHHIQDNLQQTLSRYYRDVKNLGVKKGPFFVLVGAHMPCVLAEVSFIDHPVEGRRLIEERYQRLIAEGLYRGIRAYFDVKRN